jgi:tetratricopeptide (TPR) repeat protein
MGGFQYFLFLVGKLYLGGWVVTLGAVGVLAYRRALEMPFSQLDYLCIVVLVLPPMLALGAVIWRPRRRFNRVVEACSWARWEEVLELLPGLPSQVPVHDRLFREAQALAGLGRMPEALSVVAPLAEGKGIPEWLYWSRLSGVYRAAQDRDQALICLERSASLAPQNPTPLIDLALGLLSRRRDTARAAEILRRVKTHALSDLVVQFLRYAEGLLALEQGKAHEARELLEEALAGQKKLASALAGKVCDHLHAYLCLAETAIGNHESARRHFNQALPRLQALGDHDLLARCEAALGDGGE